MAGGLQGTLDKDLQKEKPVKEDKTIIEDIQTFDIGFNVTHI